VFDGLLKIKVGKKSISLSGQAAERILVE